MTPADKEKIEAIERDRRRKEEELLALLLGFLALAQRLAGHAVLLDASPADAVLRVWLGSPRTGFPGAAPALANVMMKSHAAGMARGAGFVGGTKPTPSDVPFDLYRGMAQTMAEQSGETLRQAVSDAVATTDDPRQQAKMIRQAFRDGGYTAENPYAVQRIATGAIMRSYGLGLWNAYQLADLRGFKHVSVVDSSTTEICLERDGLELSKDDPYWLTGWPPLHFSCRSSVLPVLHRENWSDSYPTTPATPGFGTIPQEMLNLARPMQYA